jgi:hypothetical protein
MTPSTTFCPYASADNAEQMQLAAARLAIDRSIHAEGEIASFNQQSPHHMLSAVLQAGCRYGQKLLISALLPSGTFWPCTTTADPAAYWCFQSLW